MLKQTKFESTADHRLQPYFYQAPRKLQPNFLEAEDRSPQATTLGRNRHFQTGISDQVPSVHQFHLQDKKRTQQEGGREKGCHKQLQQQTMTSNNTDDPTYPNHEWFPSSLTAARRKFASTRRLLHKKTQRRILIAALIRLEYMKDAPADQVASVNAFDGRGDGEDGTNRSDTNTALSEQPHTNPPATVATKIKRR